jgi:hypothetical protein
VLFEAFFMESCAPIISIPAESLPTGATQRFSASRRMRAAHSQIMPGLIFQLLHSF